MSLRQNLLVSVKTVLTFSYQSECHCAKTYACSLRLDRSLVTSQNVTAPKLVVLCPVTALSLVTSQNVTAPKHAAYATAKANRLVTSQNVTAPKQILLIGAMHMSLVTSQNVTAPKPLSQNLPCKETSIPTGSEITSEQSSRSIACLFSFILS